MKKPECFVCGAPVRHDYTQVAVFDHYSAVAPRTTTYCSKECEAEDQRGDWAPKWCTGCGRLIRLRPFRGDLRDPDAANFVTRADGTVLCQRCANTH